jgi:hypothetical protein
MVIQSNYLFLWFFLQGSIAAGAAAWIGSSAPTIRWSVDVIRRGRTLPASNQDDDAACTTDKWEQRAHSAALVRGKAFFESIMKSPQKVNEGILYFKDVFLLDGAVQHIIITKEIDAFWRRCIDVVIEAKRRVCASGSPGVGKSTTMMYAMRLLVERGNKVVYLERSVNSASF